MRREDIRAMAESSIEPSGCLSSRPSGARRVALFFVYALVAALI